MTQRNERPHWAITRVTAPTSEVLTTTEAKKHLRIEDNSDDDAYVAGLSRGWREWLEDRTNRSFITQTWDYFQDRFPDGNLPIELPRGPVVSSTGVVSVKYTTTSATTALTLSATAYSVDIASSPARVGLKTGQSWPTALLRDQNGVEVRFISGFATSATGAEQGAKTVLRLLVGSSYVNREAVVVGSINTQLNFAVDTLVANLDERRYM